MSGGRASQKGRGGARRLRSVSRHVPWSDLASLATCSLAEWQRESQACRGLFASKPKGMHSRERSAALATLQDGASKPVESDAKNEGERFVSGKTAQASPHPWAVGVEAARRVRGPAPEWQGKGCPRKQEMTMIMGSEWSHAGQGGQGCGQSASSACWDSRCSVSPFDATKPVACMAPRLVVIGFDAQRGFRGPPLTSFHDPPRPGSLNHTLDGAASQGRPPGGPPEEQADNQRPEEPVCG